MRVPQFDWIDAWPLAAVASTPNPVSQRLREFSQHEEVRAALAATGILMAVSLLIAVFAIWFAGKLFVEEATFGKAFKVWLLQWIWSVVWVVGLVCVLSVMIAKRAGLDLVPLVVGVWLFLFLLSMVLVACKVYRAGFFRGIGIFVVSVILNLLLSIALNTLVLRSQGLTARFAALERITGTTKPEQQAFYNRLFGIDAPDEIVRALDDATRPFGPRKPLPEREAAVRSIQQQLEARRRNLLPGDAAGALRFQQLSLRYVNLLNDLKAERAAQR